MRKTVPVLAATAVLAGGLTAILAQQPALFGTSNVDAFEVSPDRGGAGMSRLLRSLQTRASLLLFTAHPDDEDGGMLAYETRGLGARAGLMTLNRGEGGQNVMSMDLYDALGLVRTQELLVADRYMGVDQFFSSVIDYGFSKTREEALEKWGHDRVLSDSVRVLRMTRPLVVASVFVGAPTDGHGNHQVAGQMAQEAFTAAGDPTKFPEQLREGLKPWTPLKVYARVPFFRVTQEGMYDYAIDKFVPVRFFDYVNQKWSNEGPSTTLEIPEGVPAPALGLTFLQIAREGLGFQKTQNGGGTLPVPAPFNSGYHRYGSRVKSADAETSFFDGIDVSVGGIATLANGDTKFLKDGLARISRFASDAMKQYAMDRPSSIAPVLADGLKATRELIDQVQSSELAEPGKSDVLFELRVKERQFVKTLAASLEISLQTTVAAAEPVRTGRGTGAAQSSTDAAFLAGRGGRGGGPTFTIAIPQQSFTVEAQLYNEGPENIAVSAIEVLASDAKNWNVHPASMGNRLDEVKGGTQAQSRFEVTVPPDTALTRPYFTRPDEEQPYYNVLDARYRNLPLAPYPLAVRAKLSFHGVPFEIAQDVQTSERVPGIGTLQNPLLVGPAISVAVSPTAGAVPLESKSFTFTCTVHSNVKGPAQGMLRLNLPAGWRANPSESPFSFTRDGEDQTLVFSIVPDAVKLASYTITAVAEYGGRSYAEGYHLTGYPGVRPYPFYRPATYKAVGVDVKTAPGLHVGFLPGTGDDVPKALENLGMNVRILATSDLTHGDLSVYDTIILGTRAYAVRQDLKSANARLMEYVKNGGVLIVQYNLQDFDHDYGPYPFTLGANPQKVVDENSPVTVLEPNSPALTWPNRITSADFDGWIEERGHGFMKTWDARYQSLVETHDPDQDPQKGGLLLARYGKGFYIYDAFALYRELPTGVPGAFRIVSNLVSISKNPGWH
ncbi:MAG TPA: PIG-L family deacetylase [Bryobacteraceae bacterium]|jgi:LmbE family N-acetylglucosaminyl deacetylase|nr:PIG-L family deacetylase [Bryobacteraceae bacterium]